MKITDGLLDEARWVGSPNYNQRPDNRDISLLVVHNISLPPGQFGTGYVAHFFCNKLDVAAHPYFAHIAEMQVSSHLFIERDGTLIQFVNLADRAWHAGVSSFCGRDNCNDYSIGIELEGTDDTPYTVSQYQQLERVTKAIMQAYPAVTPERIAGHNDIAPGRKTDPGPMFDWPAYRRSLARQD